MTEAHHYDVTYYFALDCIQFNYKPHGKACVCLQLLFASFVHDDYDVMNHGEFKHETQRASHDFCSLRRCNWCKKTNAKKTEQSNS